MSRWQDFLADLGWNLHDGGLPLRRALRWSLPILWRRTPEPPKPLPMISELMDATLRNRGPALAEAITKNNPLLQHLSRNK